MLVDRCQRRQIESPSNLFETGGVAVLLNEVVEVVQNFALALREREHGHPPVFSGLETGKTICEHKAKINRWCYTRRQPAPGGASMSSRFSIWVLLLLSGIGLGALQAAGVSEQQADAFSQKMATVKKQGIQGISGVQAT